MIQKVIIIGSSAGITIPKESLKELGLKIGDKVRVEVKPEKGQVIVESVTGERSEVIDWTDQFIEKYKVALKALSQK